MMTVSPRAFTGGNLPAVETHGTRPRLAMSIRSVASALRNTMVAAGSLWAASVIEPD
jgi:hypothetical protein